MKITDALLGEHAVLYRLFDHGSERLAAWNLAQVQEAGALLESALLGHAHLEEELLFDALAPRLPPGMGVLAVMRAEHEEIEGSLRRLAEATDAEGARALYRHAIAVARQHFAKEEQVLFHFAERFLGEAGLAELGRTWAERAMPGRLSPELQLR